MNEICEDLERGALTGSVGTEQPGEAVPLDVERQIVHRDEGTELPPEVDDLDRIF